MHVPQSNPATRPHPLLIIAALAVILFCAVGTAAIMGWLPSSSGGTRGKLNDADRAELAAGLQQPGQATPTTLPASATVTAAPSAYPAQPLPYVAQEAAAPASAVASTPAAVDSNWCGNCGNVESVRQITTRTHASGVGAAGGALLGGLLGNQVGSGHGRQLATVAGAVGGAVMGNRVEGNMNASHSYEIRVRLDDGHLRTFHQQHAPQWRNGDRVRVIKGSLKAA